MRALMLAALCVAALCGCSDSNAKKSVDSKGPEKVGTSGALDDAAADPCVAANDAAIAQSLSSGQVRKTDAAWKLALPKFPNATLTPGTTYYWDVETNLGAFRVKLFADVAPNHVRNMIYLTRLGFYDGVVFHRVIPGFMAQGGDPTGTGMGSPGYKFAGEFSPTARHDRPFLLSAANAGPNTDGSQFFITFAATPWLNDKHTIFGEVVEGTETVRAMEPLGSQSGATNQRIEIVKATIRIE